MLEERLNEDMKAALKAGNAKRLSVLRMMRSQILLEKKKDVSITTLGDDEVVLTLSAYAKKLRDSVGEFERIGERDRAEEIKAEIEVVQEYLPARLTDDEVKELIRSVLADIGATSPKDFGRAMKEAQARSKGRADGKLLSELIRAALR